MARWQIRSGADRNIVIRDGMYYFRRRYMGHTYVVSMGIRDNGSRAAAVAALKCREQLETDLVNWYYHNLPLHPCPKRFEAARQSICDMVDQALISRVSAGVAHDEG